MASISKRIRNGVIKSEGARKGLPYAAARYKLRWRRKQDRLLMLKACRDHLGEGATLNQARAELARVRLGLARGVP